MGFTVSKCIFLFLATSAVFFVAPWGQFPLNDDWVYTKNVVSTLANGKFTVSSGQYAYAIPQVLVGLTAIKSVEEPFLALRWIGIASGVLSALLVSLLCLRALEMRNSVWLLLSSISVFFFFPCLQTSFSFMTDMPAFLLWVASVWALANFLKKKTIQNVSLAFFVNLLAVSERQLAALIPLSVLVFQNRDFRLREGWNLILKRIKKNIPFLMFLIPVVFIEWWWKKISPLKGVPLGFSPNPGVFIRFFCHLVCLGWLAIPFVGIPKLSWKNLEGIPRKVFRNSLSLFLVGGVLYEGPFLASGGFSLPPFFNNLLSDVGILPVVLQGFSEPIFPIWFKVILLLVGVWGAFQIIKGFSLLWSEVSLSPIKQTIFVSSFGYFIFICFRYAQFDRYAIPVVPLCLLAILRLCKPLPKPSVGSLVFPAICASVYLSFSSTLVADYFRWNEARWEAIKQAHSLGIAREKLWGGYEYLGWYNLVSTWEQQKKLPYVIRPTPVDGFEILKKVPYRSFWGTRNREMLLLKEKETSLDS